MIIAVIGGSKCTPTIAKLAEAVGREIASRGHTVVCGGLNGVMEAASRGAKSAGGAPIGILPGHDPHDANPYIDIPIVTGMGYARNVIVVKTARVVIAVDGEYGTLSEIAHALGEGIPVVGLETWALRKNGSKADKGIILASDPVDAVSKAVTAAGAPSRRRRRPVKRNK